jgi:nitrogen fixation protein
MTIKVTYNVTDVYVTQDVSPVYINVSYSSGSSGAAVWGGITGTLSNQTDLQTALDGKFDDPTGTTSQYLRGDGSLATFPSLTGYVPYTGATTNVDLGEYEIKAGQVTLDTSPTGTAAVGTTRWNDTTGVSETTLKGGSVLLRNGVDLVARVVNKVTPNTTLTKAAYQAVRVSGAQGQRLAIALAQANNDTNSADTIGLVIETIPTNQEGFIMAVGQLEGINTTGSLQGETWVDGDVLYLSPTIAGAITNVKPTGGGHIVVIGYVEYAHQNNGKIYVKVMNGWELEELHDVDIVTPANNQGLFYESSTSLWKNKSISTVLGYTPEQPLTFNSPLSRSINAVSIPQATGSINGFLSATDWTTFNSKQAALGFTPANAATTLTINGVTYDLSTSRTWTIAAGISGSGAAGQVTYWTGASAVSGSNNLFWNNTNARLGIGIATPAVSLDVRTSAVGELAYFANTAANSGLIIGTQTNVGYISSVSSLSALGFGINGTTTAIRIFTNSNVSINNNVDLGVRFSVVGDTRLVGSGNTSATTALTVQNSDSTNLLRVRNDGALLFSNGSDLQIYSQQNSARSSGIGSGFAFQSSLGSGIVGPDFRFFNGFVGSAITSGTRQGVLVNNIGFLPTSGTATYTILQLESLINQTGGANGVTRGLYVNPNLVAAADFRAIETTNGKVIFGNLPTSSAGLPTGALWNDAGTIKIV